MKVAAVLLSVVGLASGFSSPAGKGAAIKSAPIKSVFDDYVGAVDFKGDEYKFDPLGLAETYSPFVPFFREAELRHGRTAMLAVLGWIATDFVRIPGDLYSFESVPSSLAAHDTLISKGGPMQQLVLWIGLFDLLITFPAITALKEGRDAGDLGWTSLVPVEKEKFDKLRVNELMNGRVAMLAFGGICTQAALTGHSFPYLY